MYKVLVVEDMDLTRDDILHLIDWEKHGFELLPDARNGKIGLEYARRYQPDIVITDIKMPVMTGLDMVDALMKLEKKPAVILLTAYEEFELAKRALQMGIQTFMLKYEIDEEVLLRELNRCVEGLKRQKNIEELRLRQKLRYIMKGNFEALSGEENILGWKGGASLFFLQIPSLDKQEILNEEKIQDILEQNIEAEKFRVVYIRERGLVIFRKDRVYLSEAQNRDSAKHFAVLVQKAIEEEFRMHVIIAVGGSIKGNKDIPVCWQRAERVMQGYVFEKGSCILENPPEEEKRNMSMSLKENLQEIETSMDNRNFGQALEYLYKIRSELERSRNIYWYKDYPNFISEHIRVAPPVKYSLEKMIHGPLWDSELLSRDRYWEKDIFPVNWLERSHEGAMPQRKTAAYWEFYEAETAEDLLYNTGAAYAREIRRYGEQVRVGNRDPRVIRERSKGYFACKLADTWPKIYCAPIDFFQEVYIPYYGMKRMMAPELLCFQREETIRLWYINDTGEDREGTVEYGLFDLTTETYIRKEQKYVRVKQGGARLVKDFGEFAFFSKDCILFASFVSEEKSQETVCIDYADIERHLRFPELELEIAAEGDILWISARHFARCVEITGEDQGDPFGWLFEDNYFDMLPGQKRGIRILGEKSEGTLTVKSHYGKKKEIFWKRSRKK